MSSSGPGKKGTMDAFLLALLVLLTVVRGDTYTTTLDPLSDEFIDYINQQQTAWTAGRNFPKDTSMESLTRLLGARIDNDTQQLPVKWHEDVQVPENFDSRQQWPNCPTIKEIRDQGHCGSCWAFGVSEAISDRICIHSNGQTKVRISANDLAFCSNTQGCDGGYPSKAWRYWTRKGIVTGGPYGSKQGCSPYEIPPTGISGVSHIPSPPCEQTCIPGYPLSYEQDKHFGKSAYSIPSIVHQIQAEILKNGPVSAALIVYTDFMAYRGGIYHHVNGPELGGHCVKIIGWGVEGGTPYWLGANSWGHHFGENGYFKILRGSNECGIETRINAGLPRL